MSPREPVVIERGHPANPPGMPRPLARNKGTLRPVPWTNADDWGILHTDRAIRCEHQSICLVCGLTVTEGYIFTDNANCLMPATQDDLDKAADNGPLHARCAKMTYAHCAHVRNDVNLGKFFMVPYCRQIPLTPSPKAD